MAWFRQLTDYTVGDNDIVPLKLTRLCISLCLLGGAFLSAQVAPASGAWRQSNLTWKKPPADLELKERYAEAAILYFSRDQRFVCCMERASKDPRLR
jgi:hypothetical protein